MRAMLALFLVLLLAGCSSNSTESSESNPSPSTSTHSVTTTTLNTTTIPPPPPAVSNATFQETAAGCKEFIGVFQIPMTQARKFVPAKYAPLGDASGKAVAFAGLKICDDVKIDGVSIGRASTADVGVLIASPDGSDQNHYYQPWWLSDNEILAGRLTAQGWRGGYTNGTTLTATLTQGFGNVAFNVPWSNGTYSMAGTVFSGGLPPAATFTGWHDGANGTVAVRKTLTSTAFGSGVATLTAAGPMAEFIGATATGLALYNEYAMDGTVGRK